MRNIRTFSIIALELTQSVDKRKMVDQFLDSMDIERERGITIKAQTVRINYKASNNQAYVLNLIDTPGHVDFTYEVSRSLAACEGVLLVVDAAQGVEAQTVANAFLAMENDLEIIPVINKIDLPSARVDEVKDEIENSLGISADDAILVSAKTGEGVDKVLEAIIERIPSPKTDTKDPLKALIFDAIYDQYRGVITYVRLFEGAIKSGQTIKLMATGKEHQVDEVGYFSPDLVEAKSLKAGDVGYIITGLRNVGESKIGDTMTSAETPTKTALTGYKEVKPVVFAGLYPIEGDRYEDLKDALEKLKLNDPSFRYEPESSNALGFGFRCGFLGLLHLEIIKERLEREYELDLIATTASVAYRIEKNDGKTIEIRNPSDIPETTTIVSIEEPFIAAKILTPPEFVGKIMELSQEKRGAYKGIEYLSEHRAEVSYDLPLAEVIVDYFDLLKSSTKGYATLDYEISDYRKSDLAKLDILLAGKVIDAFSAIVPKDNAYYRGRKMVEKLKELIPRQLFEVAIQASIGSRIISRETVKPMRKDVIAKLYGGDVTRKKKLLEKQKKGKKRMKMVGQVEVPQKAFVDFLKVT
ncbi:hypothetical protein LCGC14_0796790 [marine sediment metagenome]|uniref:Tr-type G domain-containing protein n=1 Tax=marine sediment metagenome TaxID=412755 RepID=A0A0F9QAP7_9ZZZZ